MNNINLWTYNTTYFTGLGVTDSNPELKIFMFFFIYQLIELKFKIQADVISLIIFLSLQRQISVGVADSLGKGQWMRGGRVGPHRAQGCILVIGRLFIIGTCNIRRSRRLKSWTKKLQMLCRIEMLGLYWYRR